MKSFSVLPVLFSAGALAQRSDGAGADGLTTFPVVLPGVTQDVQGLQATFVAVTSSTATLALNCATSGCGLAPSPTLALNPYYYSLNLGTVLTRVCTPASTSYEDPSLTLVCTESTSGVDKSSHTTTYAGTDEIHYGIATLVAGLDKFSSALSSISEGEGSTTAGGPARTPAGATTSVSTTASTSSGSLTSSTATSSASTNTASTTTSSTSTSTTSITSSPSNAAGTLNVGHGITWIGAVMGAFASLFL